MNNFNTETGTISFYLKNPKLNEESLIMGVYLFKNLQVAFSAGIKIPIQNWNSDSKQITSGKFKKEQNSKLNKLKLSIIQSHINFNENYSRLPEKHELKAIVKDAIDGSDTKNVKKGKKTMEDVYNEVINIIDLRNQNAVNSANAGKVTKSIHKSYKSSFNVAFGELKEFSREKNIILDIDTFNEIICLEFQNWLIESKGLSLSTVRNRIKRISHILKRAFEKNYTSNRSYLLDEFKVKVPPTVSTSLTEEEIKLLYENDLSNNPKLEKIRDLFVLACHTGLRFSDVTRIQFEHIDLNQKAVKILTSKSSKTDSYKYANFKFFGFTEEILKKYNYDITLIAISNQKANEYLKEVFNTINYFKEKEIKIEVPSSNGVKFIKHSFMDLIDFHTSRRSFCTNRYCEGWELLQIWDYTTHSDESTFKTYFRPTPEHERIRQENIRKRSAKLQEFDFKDKQLEVLQKQMLQILELHKKGDLESVGKIIQMNTNAS